MSSIRYSPSTENEKQALAFDEIAPSDDGMNYEEWEEMRAVKTAALLKLTRFIRQVVSVHSFRFVALNGITRSTLPLESKMRISPEQTTARPCA